MDSIASMEATGSIRFLSRIQGHLVNDENPSPFLKVCCIFLLSDLYYDNVSSGVSKSSDLSSAYGYGSVAWKDRVDNWKSRQEKLQMTTTDGVAPSTRSKAGSVDDNGVDGADTSMYEASYFYISVLSIFIFEDSGGVAEVS